MQAKRGQQTRVQRPMILDVLPADMAPRLDVKPLTFRQKAVRAVPKNLRHRWTPLVGVVAVAGLVVAVWQPWRLEPVKLPPNIASQVSGFVPYFFESKLPSDLKLNQNTLNYSDGILFFQIKDQSGESVVVSEQALPSDFANSMPQGDETVEGVRGGGVISIRDSRTIGTLITNKDPKALISLDAVSSVDSSVLEKIMQALRPVN